MDCMELTTLREFQGARRWAHGEWVQDSHGEWTKVWKYYTFPEWFKFVECQGMDEDDAGNKGYWAVAINLWNRAVDEVCENHESEASRRQYLANDVGDLAIMTYDDLIQVGVSTILPIVLEPRDGVPSSMIAGNSLRVCKDGTVDRLGGAGKYAVFDMEVLAIAPTLQARFKNAHYGVNLLHADGTFFGSTSEGTVFELFPRHNALPVITILPLGQLASAGSFLLRRATLTSPANMPAGVSLCPTTFEADLVKEVDDLECNALKDEAQGLVDKDQTLQGWRCCAMDPNCKYYTFAEFVEYFMQDGVQPDKVIAHARAMWAISYLHWDDIEKLTCAAISKDASLQGQRCWCLDPSGANYSFVDFVGYVFEKGWGGTHPEGLVEAAAALWKCSSPEQENDKMHLVVETAAIISEEDLLFVTASGVAPVVADTPTARDST